MRILKLTLVLCTAVLLNFCSETNVKYGKIDESIDAPPISGLFKKRVLVEDFTGTWCGNCTRVAYGVEQLLEQSDKVVAVAVHNGDDPFNYDGIEPLRAQIYPETGDFPLPTARLNRTVFWKFPVDINIQQAKNLTSNNCGLGLALKSSIQNEKLNVDVNLKFAQDYNNLKLVVYIMEDGLIYNQVNYTSFYNNQNPVINFVHNHVLRSTLTKILGDEITENTNAGSALTKQFSINLPSNITNSTNISIAAFVLDSKNTSINARDAKINDIQDFEIN
jgi:thiol-disulfide isomerase/thioredoxin